MERIGDLLFFLIGMPIALIVVFYLRALLPPKWDPPLCKPVFGPFTKGLIADWAFSSLWVDLSFLVPVLFSLININFTETAIIFLCIVFWSIGIYGGGIIRKKIDGKGKEKQKIIDFPPIRKPTLGPFTRGRIVAWIVTIIWSGLLLFTMYLLVCGGTDITDGLTLDIFIVFWVAGVFGSGILRKKIDGKQKIKDAMDSKP